MKFNLILTAIFFVVLCLFFVSTKKHDKKQTSSSDTQKQIDSQVSLRFMVFLFVKMGFNKDTHFLLDTLNESCQKTKKVILNRIKTSLSRFRKLQQEKKDILVSPYFFKLTRFILVNLNKCKTIKSKNKNLSKKIRAFLKSIKKLTNSFALQGHFKKLNEKYIEKGKKLPKKMTNKLLKNYWKIVVSKKERKSYKKAMKSIRSMSKKCAKMKKQCNKKKQICKKMKKVCDKLTKKVDWAKNQILGKTKVIIETNNKQ